MSDIIKFDFNNLPIDIVLDVNNEPLWEVNQVCKVLGYGNPSQAMSSHVQKDDLQKREVIDSLGRTQQKNYINEGGLYDLIMGCKLPQAKPFKQWVTHTVLPTIRKTGSYGNAALALANATKTQILQQALLISQENDRLLEENSKQALQLETQAPKVEAFTQLLDTDGTFSRRNVARIIGVTESLVKEAVRDLRLGYWTKPDGKGAFRVYASAIKDGFYIERAYVNGSHSGTQPRLTIKGLELIREWSNNNQR